MKRVAVVALVLLVAGCGGAKKAAGPETALLIGVDVQAAKVVFTFKSAPQTVTERWVPRSQLVESGSGRPVPLEGAAYLMIHFQPAATAVADASSVTFTYAGPKRIEGPGPGPVLEVAKTSDFEADLAWAIGLERRLAVRLAQDGATITVGFG